MIQGALLTQEDVGRILGVSSRTIRRDVVELLEKKVRLYLRGLQRDIGKGISHKIWIVGLYLQQKTYSEIERITGHSIGAIKIYLNDFSRIVMAGERRIRKASEIGFYVGRSERLVQEYVGLIRQAERDPQQRGTTREYQEPDETPGAQNTLKKKGIFLWCGAYDEREPNIS